MLDRRQFLAMSAAATTLTALPGTAAAADYSTANYSVPWKMRWWHAARFGMFIHFGSYSYLGHGEWAFSNENWDKQPYQEQVSKPFDPEKFDAAEIVGLAKAAGMKYLVITTKHHEGFAMWDSKVASFTDTTGTTPYTLPGYTVFKRDILAELKRECERQGLKLGLYYSILDWNHSSQHIRNTDTVYSTMASWQARADYIRDMKAHLAELLTRYDPAILWFDGDWSANRDVPTLDDWWNKPDGIDLYDYLLRLRPNLIVNERVKRDLGLGDFACPEQTVPAKSLARPWETCATMNWAWGYNASLENAYRPAATIIKELITVVSRDGNYLLNIGPKGTGEVTDGAKSVLAAFNAWMTTNSDSIHGASASPFAEPTWGRFTSNGNKIYAHIFTWPTTGQLHIPELAGRIRAVYLDGIPARHSTSPTGLTITLPSSPTSAYAPVVTVVK